MGAGCVAQLFDDLGGVGEVVEELGRDGGVGSCCLQPCEHVREGQALVWALSMARGSWCGQTLSLVNSWIIAPGDVGAALPQSGHQHLTGSSGHGQQRVIGSLAGVLKLKGSPHRGALVSWQLAHTVRVSKNNQGWND